MRRGLELQGVGLRLGDAEILEDITFSVKPGRCVVILGPNGAGKSSSLAIASGTLAPTLGHAMLDNRPLSEWSKVELARRRAVVTQRSELTFGFVVLDVVLLGRHPFCDGLPGRLDVSIAEAALERVGLHHMAARTYTTLSGGERQRVQIARSLVQLAGRGPEDGAQRYWLLDEPTSALDLAHKHSLMRLCREEADRGRGLLMVLHDLDLALRVADEIVLLERGRCRRMGAPTEVLTAATIREVYGVEAAVISATSERPAHVLVMG